MPKIYHPFIYEDVDASPPHDPLTQYRVSFGIEYWDDEQPQEVAKIQMVYDGVVSGRRSPSFPAGTNDVARCVEAFKRLYVKALHQPMTAERFKAFAPDGAEAAALRDAADTAVSDRITSKMLKKYPQKKK